MKTPARWYARRCATLEREEQEYAAKLESLRAAIDEGDESGIAEGNVFARVLETLHLPSHR